MSLRLACVLACVRRAQQLVMGHEWSAPRKVGSELLLCADTLARDGMVDCPELVVLVQQCFVPASSDATTISSMLKFVTPLVSCVCLTD